MENFLGEIMAVPYQFAPRGWAFCNGQTLAISSNTALFSLLGTTFGGNGVTTFALPDLQGRSPIGVGQGPGLSDRSLGETGGDVAEFLNPTQIPLHTHSLQVSENPATTAVAVGNFPAETTGSSNAAYEGTAAGAMPVGTVGSVGNGLPHTNLQPYLGHFYVIALQGIFPQRP